MALKLIPMLWFAAGCLCAADVLTERYDNGRTGSTLQPGMNPSLFAGQRWHKLGELPVDGRVYAQPLFAQNVQMRSTGRPHNAVFVGTSSNFVYAFDAQTLARLWGPVNLGHNDPSLMGQPGCDGISPDGIGIEATPAIDRSLNRMFVSYRTNTGNNPATAKLLVSSLDLSSGDQTFVEAQGIPPVLHRSRASLLLLNGTLYVAYGSRCEDPGEPIFHGWIAAFNEQTLQQVASLRITPDDIDGGGIWQAASGLASDGSSLYFSTGNRRLDVGNRADVDNVADAVVRVAIEHLPRPNGTVGPLTMRIADWFQPYRKIWLDQIDMDLGSAGVLLIPGTNLLVAGGKQGLLYLLNRGSLGRMDEAKKWTLASLGALKRDSTADQFPEDFTADHAVQKFQASFHQYIPANPSYLARPGSPVVSQDQREVFTVGRDGAVYVTWRVDATSWSDTIGGRPGPARITPADQMPVSAHLAAGKPTNNQMEVFYIGNDGAVHTTWKVNNGRWTDGQGGQAGPAQITPARVAPPGGCLLAANTMPNQFEVFYVGNDGAVHTTWKVNNGRWTDGLAGHVGPAQISPASTALPGGCLSTGQPTANQFEVFYAGNDGAVHTTWKVNNQRWTDGLGGHTGPAQITPVNLVRAGAPLVSAMPTANQLEVCYVGRDGAVHTTWKVNNGRWSDGLNGFRGPAQITPAGVAGEGTYLASNMPNAGQLEVFYAGLDGAIHTTWKVNNGRWTDGLGGNMGPAQITPAGQAPAIAGVASNKPGENNLEVAYVGFDGALHLTWKVNNQRWSDGLNGFTGPSRLSRALWMNEWFDWPHIHGTPVFGKFTDGSALLYIWPEKDHIKAFPWLAASNRFDVDHKILGVDGGRRLIVGPDGMPGGMLAAAIDSSQPRAGVLFASQTQDARTDGPGMLRAFDATNLVEVWNNRNDAPYRFSKFVPPTIAGGRVFVPTAGLCGDRTCQTPKVTGSAGRVLVYGQ